MASRLRSPAVALAVGALVGVVVAGGGARLAMRLIALADDREDFGLATEGGDVVGEVTLEGTLFVLLTGLVLGIVGAFLYLALRGCLPERPVLRALMFALIILGFGLTATVNGNDADFVFVNTVVSIVSFANQHAAPLVSEENHSASRTLTTNQPSVTGASPEPESSSRASDTNPSLADKRCV